MIKESESVPPWDGGYTIQTQPLSQVRTPNISPIPIYKVYIHKTSLYLFSAFCIIESTGTDCINCVASVWLAAVLGITNYCGQI